MVVCQPGNCDTEKSNDTIECTDNTSGVAKPARIKYAFSLLLQCRFEPVQPNKKQKRQNKKTPKPKQAQQTQREHPIQELADARFGAIAHDGEIGNQSHI